MTSDCGPLRFPRLSKVVQLILICSLYTPPFKLRRTANILIVKQNMRSVPQEILDSMITLKLTMNIKTGNSAT